jgi:hypothetical protein
MVHQNYHIMFFGGMECMLKLAGITASVAAKLQKKHILLVYHWCGKQMSMLK